jgi:hypothetical protein
MDDIDEPLLELLEEDPESSGCEAFQSLLDEFQGVRCHCV